MCRFIFCDLVSPTVSGFPLLDATIWSGTCVEHRWLHRFTMIHQIMRSVIFQPPEAGCLVLRHWLWNLTSIPDGSFLTGHGRSAQFNPIQSPFRSSWILGFRSPAQTTATSLQVVELFPVEVRTAGMGLSYNVPGCVFEMCIFLWCFPSKRMTDYRL